MNRRENRLKTIRKIISSDKVPTQAHLLNRLEREGLSITQATLSRDLKTLKASKVPEEDGQYFFTLNGKESLPGFIEDFKRGFLSLTFSRNLGVIKTLAGHADTVAIALDNMEMKEVLGTIAGDDTILVVLSENEKRHVFAERLENMLGNLGTRK